MKTAKIKVVSGDERVRSVFTDGGGGSGCCCCFRLRRQRRRHHFIDRHGTLRHSGASSPHGLMVRVSLMTVHCSGCQQMCAGTVRVVLHFMMQVQCISRAILTLLQANTVTAHECGSPVYPLSLQPQPPDIANAIQQVPLQRMTFVVCFESPSAQN